MTAKEKAIELYYRYETLGKDFTRGVSMREFAKQCALLAVDEMIKLPNAIGINDLIEYWEQVKQEIKQL
jgi:hypothetical protein